MSSWDNWGDERGCDVGHWHAHTRGLSWGLPEVVGTVEQVHCSHRRLLRRGREFHVGTINKSPHTKKSGNLSYAAYIYIYIYMCVCVYVCVYVCVINFLDWFFAGQPILLCPFVAANRRTSLASPSLFLLKCPSRLIFLSQMLCEIGGYYLPTPPLGQDMTQGQFLSRVYRFEFRFFLLLD